MVVLVEVAIGCEFAFDVPVATHAIVLVEPHESERERVLKDRFSTDPDVAAPGYTDLFGNWCRRLTMPAGRFGLTYEATVETSGEIDAIDEGAAERPPSELPDEALLYLLPSRYCQSDQIAPFAFEQFGTVPMGWGRVHAISQWVHDHIQFDYMSASSSATSMDVLASGRGVCRDFTHLAVAICRALNIPTRYVFGYLPDIGVPDPGLPMDFCAWMEVYLGDRWYTFDPRNHQQRIGRTVIGRGRDAADVAMVTTFGSVQLVSMTVVAEEIAS
jgi:transglutaminase-like putative cysteine protease